MGGRCEGVALLQKAKGRPASRVCLRRAELMGAYGLTRTDAELAGAQIGSMGANAGYRYAARCRLGRDSFCIRAIR
jgi:hypothetical protein